MYTQAHIYSYGSVLNGWYNIILDILHWAVCITLDVLGWITTLPSNKSEIDQTTWRFKCFLIGPDSTIGSLQLAT